MSDQQPPAKSVLDQAYEGLGHVGAAIEANQQAQQQSLRDLEARERELQAKLDQADPEQAKAIEAELDELTRAWRTVTDDLDANA